MRREAGRHCLDAFCETGAVRLVLCAAAAGALAWPAALHASVRPLSAAERTEIVSAKEWYSACPVSLSQLRLLTVRYHGFDGRVHQAGSAPRAVARDGWRARPGS